MNNTFSYIRAIPYGLYMNVIQHAFFFYRFGRLNTRIEVPPHVTVASSEHLFFIVGILSVMLLFYFMKKLPSGAPRRTLFAFFIVAVCLGTIGSVGGGLFGPIGVLIYGLVPFLVILPIGYGLARGVQRFLKK